jgi:hypothetical protein
LTEITKNNNSYKILVIREKNKIHSGNIEGNSIIYILKCFRFDKETSTNIQEARKMLISLGVNENEIFQRSPVSISGKVEENKEITIWINSYDNLRQYGIRYGNKDGKYWGSNETLISIDK